MYITVTRNMCIVHSTPLLWSKSGFMISILKESHKVVNRIADSSSSRNNIENKIPVLGPKIIGKNS